MGRPRGRGWFAAAVALLVAAAGCFALAVEADADKRRSVAASGATAEEGVAAERVAREHYERCEAREVGFALAGAAAVVVAFPLLVVGVSRRTAPAKK